MVLPIFPLNGAVLFPGTSLPLNIFEDRYIKMVNYALAKKRHIGMIQTDENSKLYNIGCLGKIHSFNETEDGRYLVILNGVSRFKIIKEVVTNKLYRQCHISIEDYSSDLENNNEEIKFSDLELVFKNLKSLFKKQGYIINWKDLAKQSLDQTINTLSMASPFTLEEKQILLETKDLKLRKEKLEEILKTYIVDEFNNSTIQ